MNIEQKPPFPLHIALATSLTIGSHYFNAEMIRFMYAESQGENSYRVGLLGPGLHWLTLDGKKSYPYL